MDMTSLDEIESKVQKMFEQQSTTDQIPGQIKLAPFGDFITHQVWQTAVDSESSTNKDKQKALAVQKQRKQAAIKEANERIRDVREEIEQMKANLEQKRKELSERDKNKQRKAATKERQKELERIRRKTEDAETNCENIRQKMQHEEEAHKDDIADIVERIRQLKGH